MAKQTYHLGLLKQGDTVVLEVARSVDQISCECWKYYGERETTFARLKREASRILAAINKTHSTAFSRIVIRKIPNNNLSAGHRPVFA